MGWCFKIIEIWNLFDIWDFVYWNFWFIQVRLIVVLSISILGTQILTAQSSWPRFRGPNGSYGRFGHELPVTFGQARNAI